MKRGSQHSAEAREKMSRTVAARWRDPEYRARGLANLKTLKPIRMGRPKGSKNSPEAIERTRQASIKRWQDPEYRARLLAHLRTVGPRGLEAARKAPRKDRRVVPPRGTPEYRWYRKVAEALGLEAARALPIKSAETEGAGRP